MASFDDVQSRRSGRDRGPIGTVPHRKPEEPERKPRDEAESTGGGGATSARGTAGSRRSSQGGEDDRSVHSPEVEERSRSLEGGRKAKALAKAGTPPWKSRVRSYSSMLEPDQAAEEGSRGDDYQASEAQRY